MENFWWKLIETGDRRSSVKSEETSGNQRRKLRPVTVAKPRAKHSLTFPTRGNDRRVRSDAAAFTSRFPRTVR